MEKMRYRFGDFKFKERVKLVEDMRKKSLDVFLKKSLGLDFVFKDKKFKEAVFFFLVVENKFYLGLVVDVRDWLAGFYMKEVLFVFFRFD